MVRRQLKKIFDSPRNSKIFVGVSLAVLFLTTTLWSLLGAAIQSGNADQLVSAYLFENSATFDNAAFPGAHTFLLKWPIFFLVKLFGSSGGAFAAFTVLLCLLTAGALVLVLYKIERRPWVFGSLCLALSSVLLLVPAQPYPGALLPVNMAMLTTRNLELVVYVLALYFLVKAPRALHVRFWLSALLLGILIASDKLFLALSFGGALLSLAFYTLAPKPKLLRLCLKWLQVNLVGLILANLILLVINSPGLPDIVNHSSLSPFGMIHSLSQAGLGIIYGLLAVLTNFGANPAFDTTILKEVPHHMLNKLTAFEGLAYIINLAILAAGVYFSFKLLAKASKDNKKPLFRSSTALSILLIWTSVTALVLYVVTAHYFAADARYLTVLVFAVFISATTYLSQKKLKPKTLAFMALILSLGVLLGLVGTVRNYQAERAALADYNQRNSTVAKAVSAHPVDSLVGDYWRVVPTKLMAGSKIKILPHTHCLVPGKTLSSQAWNIDLKSHSFAYLLSLDRSPTDYKNCTFEQVIDTYGRPNSSFLVAGSLDHPLEQLLFYDRGINTKPLHGGVLLPEPSTVLPIKLSQLPHGPCEKFTIMNIVAHQDDDLLFTSPNLLHDIQAGNCIRTIYLTAGDAGTQQLYWLNRERGSEAAYSSMLKSSQPWISRIIKLNSRQFITISTPRHSPQISLLFLHLPDGNLKGNGFAASNYESLAKLERGKISTMHSVDSQSKYSSEQLISALATLMDFYQPTEIRSQSSVIDGTFPDHSDHIATGHFAQKAYLRYLEHQPGSHSAPSIKFYLGYSGRSRAPNVPPEDVAPKLAAFLSYAAYDKGVCQTAEECSNTPTYGSYIQRQYISPY